MTYTTFTINNEFYKVSVYTDDDNETLLFENVSVFNPLNGSREQFFESITEGYEGRGVIFEITRLVSAEQPSYVRRFKKQS